MPRDTLSIIVSFLAGGIVALIAHGFAIYRENKSREHAARNAKTARKREFLSFLRGWRIELVRENPRAGAARFGERVREFEQRVEIVTGDFGVPFEDLVRSVSSLRDSDVESENGRTILLQKLDAVRNFVKAN